MKTEKEIKKRIEEMKEIVRGIEKGDLLLESKRIAITATIGAIDILEWVLE